MSGPAGAEGVGTVAELSAEEAQALREAIRRESLRTREAVRGDSPEAPGTPVRAARPAEARRYDFRVPDKFPKDVLRQIHHLHEGMARTLTTALSAQLRATVRVQAVPPEQRTYEEFVAETADPAILVAFAADPLLGSCLLDLDPAIAFPMIDRLLGGNGDGPGGGRPVTEIELTVIQRVLQTVLDNWREAWGHVSPLRPRILGIETNRMFMQLVAPNEIVLAVALVCGLGRHEGRVRMCFPHALLEPLLHRLASRQWAATSSEAPGARQAELRRGLADVQVPVSVEIGRVRLPLGRVAGLRPGDILPLGSPDGPARVHVHGHPKFTGRVGSAGGCLAVRIGADPPA